MYIILVYDCGETRVGKMLKLCRQYLNWIQNSVFEGDLSPVQLKELKVKIKNLIDEQYDSVIIFQIYQANRLHKEVVGQDKNTISCFL